MLQLTLTLLRVARNHDCVRLIFVLPQASLLPKRSQIAIRVDAETSGYVGIGHPERKGRMVPADSEIGWCGEDNNTNVLAYKLNSKHASKIHEQPSIPLLNSGCKELDGWTSIWFVRDLAVGDFPIAADGQVPINLVRGKQDGIHSHPDSAATGFDIDLTGGRAFSGAYTT